MKHAIFAYGELLHDQFVPVNCVVFEKSASKIVIEMIQRLKVIEAIVTELQMKIQKEISGKMMCLLWIDCCHDFWEVLFSLEQK